MPASTRPWRLAGRNRCSPNCERVGEEWAEARDEDVEKFHKAQLERSHQEPPRAAAVMLDGGRLQTRADGAGRERGKLPRIEGGLLPDAADEGPGVDPEPEPPSKFLEPTEAARLASGIKRRSRPADDCDEKTLSPSPKKRQERQKRRRRRNRQRTLVRAGVATMENSEMFGWQVAAEVHCRGLERVTGRVDPAT